MSAHEVFAVAPDNPRVPAPASAPSPPSRIERLAARARAATARLSERRAREMPDAPSRIVVGYASYGDPTVHASDGSPHRLVVGRFCSIATGCEVLVEDADVALGNDVWLGMGVKVYPGVTIGDGAVAAAWSVVVDDVPPYAVVAGNPARVIKTRFDDETIAALLRIRWWDWSDDRIVANWRALCSAELDAFVHAHEPAPLPDLLHGSAAV